MNKVKTVGVSALGISTSAGLTAQAMIYRLSREETDLRVRARCGLLLMGFFVLIEFFGVSEERWAQHLVAPSLA